MAAKRKTLWQILAAQLLLVAVPLYGLAPELSALASTRGDWEPQTRLRVSSSALEEQPQAIERFHPEIASGDSFHAEGIGTIRALTDEQGNVTDRYTLEAFGTLLDHLGDDPNAYLFAGEPLDPNSGFYYNRARWLEISLGAFISADPFAGVPDAPLSLQKYLYAIASPQQWRDPSGLMTGMDIGAAMRIQVTNFANISVRFITGVYRARYVRAALKAIDFTFEVLDIAQAVVRAANGDVSVFLEYAMQASLGRLDIVFKSLRSGKFLRLELKNFNFDDWQWMSPEILQRRADDLVAQARRFVDDTGTELGSGVTYLFRNIPNSPQGRRIRDYIQGRLRAAGVTDIVEGIDDIRDLLVRELT